MKTDTDPDHHLCGIPGLVEECLGLHLAQLDGPAPVEKGGQVLPSCIQTIRLPLQPENDNKCFNICPGSILKSAKKLSEVVV
jgi:hypothetical protein